MILPSTILSTNTELLVVPALTNYASVAILLCNVGASDETVTLYAVPSGGTAGATNTIMKNFVLPAENTYIFDTKLLLGAGDKIVAIGSTGNLATATVTYIAI
jgi:hypothetical protein